MNKITCIEDIDRRIKEIWNSPYMSNLPEWVKKRGYIYADPVKYADSVKRDILITGINPSFRKGEEEKLANCHGLSIKNFDPEKWKEGRLKCGKKGIRWDTYWGPMYKMLCIDDINLLNRFDYLDIFHFREQEQSKLSKEILQNDKMYNEDGRNFIVDELNLTQHIIEDVIQPRLILVKNKESWAYWGKLKDEGLIWMGYDFIEIRKYSCGDLCMINGLLDSNERIAPEITNENTNLKGTYVLFSEHITRYTEQKKRPTAHLLNELLNEISK